VSVRFISTMPCHRWSGEMNHRRFLRRARYVSAASSAGAGSSKRL
jgi:hypothetical protein